MKSELVDKLWKGLWHLFLAPRCTICGRVGSLFCEDCISQIKFVENFSCAVCGRVAPEGFTHRFCSPKQNLDRLISFYEFSFPIREVIHNLKYRHQFRLAEVLADLMVTDLKALYLDLGFDTIIIPVPMYFERRFRRWFNQAELLAMELGKRLKLEVRRDLLKRVFDTPSQTRLSQSERKQNVEGVFWVPFWKRHELKGRDVLLVDDVCTTGATLNSCARTLKRAGARLVWGFTVARD